MRDGKALQMGTSHELGQNFARAFDIAYLDDQRGDRSTAGRRRGGRRPAWSAALIMAHGDDHGLRVPPRAGPDPGRGARWSATRTAPASGGGAGRRAARPPACGCGSTTGSATSFGRRATDWELKGVPVRVEVGPATWPRDAVTLVRRDTGDEASRCRSAALASRRRRSCVADDPGRRCWPRPRSRRDDRTAERRTRSTRPSRPATGLRPAALGRRAGRGRGAAGGRRRHRALPATRRRNAAPAEDEADLVASWPAPTDRPELPTSATPIGGARRRDRPLLSADGCPAAILQVRSVRSRAKAWASAHAFRLTERRCEHDDATPTACASSCDRSSPTVTSSCTTSSCRVRVAAGSSSTPPGQWRRARPRRPRRRHPGRLPCARRGRPDHRPLHPRGVQPRARADAAQPAHFAGPWARRSRSRPRPASTASAGSRVSSCRPTTPSVVVRPAPPTTGRMEQRLAYDDIERARTVFEWGPARPAPASARATRRGNAGNERA